MTSLFHFLISKTTTIQYYRKNVYGRELMYFVDHGQEQRFYKLTGRKTLTQEDINTLTSYGVIWQEALAPVKT